ncbi:MAG: SoxR reducing system RseC family protein [Clostridia bacterium]|nr:SoxR reducing system RseC family protein [Clostridia bacterium]
MKETGIVTKLNKNTVSVKVNCTSDCSKCGMCSSKNRDTSKDFVAKIDGFDVKVGDNVTIETQKDLRLISYLLIFGIPLILVVLSIVIGTIYLNELWTVFIAVVSVALWYALLSLIDKRISVLKGYSYKVTHVYKKEQDINQDK